MMSDEFVSNKLTYEDDQFLHNCLSFQLLFIDNEVRELEICEFICAEYQCCSSHVMYEQLC